ncbi:hypothetical protein DXG01_012631 [Tephrocybe rancida]|nr:hypothetical protein DXG01_012631 [Tephrocybe rancida]
MFCQWCSLRGYQIQRRSGLTVECVQSSPRALKQRNELLSSFDTLTSHLNTTFTALSSAFARMRTISKGHADTADMQLDHARTYMGVFVGSSTASAKAKVIFALDGLEIKAIGTRDDVAENEEELEDNDDDDDSQDGTDEDKEGRQGDQEEDGEDEEEEQEEQEEEEETNEEGEDSSSLPPESPSPSPEPSYPSHAEQQQALQAVERLLARTLAASDAEGNGMSADLAPTQTHILLRAPRRFVHPAWIPRQNISAPLESTLDEFLCESGVHIETEKPRKPLRKGKAVEGVWVVGRGGLNTALGKDTIRASDDEWDEMIWWSWDGKIVGFSDW